MQIWMSTQKSGGFYPQNGWWKYHGKPYEQMDDLGLFPLFLVQHPNFMTRHSMIRYSCRGVSMISYNWNAGIRGGNRGGDGSFHHATVRLETHVVHGWYFLKSNSSPFKEAILKTESLAKRYCSLQKEKSSKRLKFETTTVWMVISSQLNHWLRRVSVEDELIFGFAGEG